eukprot:2441357-Rhodomonas_salina.1
MPASSIKEGSIMWRCTTLWEIRHLVSDLEGVGLGLELCLQILNTRYTKGNLVSDGLENMQTDRRMEPTIASSMDGEGWMDGGMDGHKKGRTM